MSLDRLLCLAASLLLPAPCGVAQAVPNPTDHSPLAFEPNRGQSLPGASYLANHRSYRIQINESSITYVTAAKGTEGALQTRVLTMRWQGAERGAQFTPESRLPGISNYLIGKDSSKWVTKVPHYSELKETGLVPGVDLRYHSDASGDLEYDLVVMPYADPGKVKLTIEGADEVRLCEGGALCIKAGRVELRQLAPLAYEMKDGNRVPVEAAYALTKGNEVSFAVLNHSPANRLVIDPVIQYATYLGGSQVYDDEQGPDSWGQSTAVDGAGNFYVAGQTYAYDFPVTPGAYLTTCTDPACDFVSMYFVSKFSPSAQLMYSTYLASTDPDQPNFPSQGKLIAADTTGDVFVFGTGSIATTPGAYQGTCTANDCAFLAKLNPDGSELLYSTYFGTTTYSGGLALGQNNDVYIAGFTQGGSVPTTSGAYQTTCQLTNDGTCFDGFAARIDTGLSGPQSLVFSTYLGVATGAARAQGIAVDQYGDAYVVGLTTADMPCIAAFEAAPGPLGFYGRSILKRHLHQLRPS